MQRHATVIQVVHYLRKMGKHRLLLELFLMAQQRIVIIKFRRFIPELRIIRRILKQR